MSNHFPCHSLPGITKLCVVKRHQRTGLSYKFWSEGLGAPLTVHPFLPLVFFLKMVVLGRCSFHFREDGKAGMCCQRVRNGDVSVCTGSGMCCEFHPPWLCSHISSWTGSTGAFCSRFHLLCAQPVLTHCISTSQDKINNMRQGVIQEVLAV